MLRRAFLLFAFGLAAWAQDNRPYVLLISLDGFRYDYPSLYSTPNLDRMADQGVRAEALIPQYPSSTFPNHLSIVTGLFPSHHGIVDNVFFDPARQVGFRYNQSPSSTDGSWYGGTPLWVLAEQQGVRTAAFFWPGSDAEIQGKRPREWRLFEGNVPNRERVRQVIDWFARPEALRPHLVTLYFSDVDSAGHEAGPKSPQTQKAVAEVDGLIGELMTGLRATGTPVDVFVVSDHGMVEMRRTVSIGSMGEFAGLQASGNGSGEVIHLYTSDARLAAEAVAKLNQRAGESGNKFRAYLRAETPEQLHYRDNPRTGDVVVIPTGPDFLYVDREGVQPPRGSKGVHGYDPSQLPEMRGIFYAAGPDLRGGLRLPAFQNVDIYPLIARLLNLTPPAGLDGSASTLQQILK